VSRVQLKQAASGQPLANFLIDPHNGRVCETTPLKGQVALVTGAARRIGRRIALQLAAAGADIAIHYRRSRDDAEATAADIQKLGRQVLLHRCDLSSPQAITHMFTVIEQRFARLDALVNNASAYYPTDLQLDDLYAHFNELFDVNVRAPLLCMAAAAKKMEPSGGNIINVLDQAASRPAHNYALYCASKAALTSLTKTFSRLLAPRIRVNGVSPGVAAWAEDHTEEIKKGLLAKIPLGHAGTADDIAQACLFLIHDGTYVTGENLVVDGGWSA